MIRSNCFTAILLLFFFSGCLTISRKPGMVSNQNYTVISSSTSTPAEKKEVLESAAEDKKKFPVFCVYTDDLSKRNHYYPSGWMGDVQDIKFSGVYQENKGLGSTCLRITYLARRSKQWAGIYWQNPPNNWGTVQGGYDLRGATAVTFWARGEKGGEKISEFKIGGLTGKNPDSDVAWIGPIKLKKQWTQYKIDLTDKDLRYISGGFCFTLIKIDNPHGCTFYLDEMRYE